jgi:hypothetical protein
MDGPSNTRVGRLISGNAGYREMIAVSALKAEKQNPAYSLPF